MDVDEDDLSEDDTRSQSTGSLVSGGRDDTRRAHHNALERVRRDHIKDCFASLKDVVPNLDPERTSRAGILKGTIDYITRIEQQIEAHEADVAELRRQNELLEAEIRAADSTIAPPSSIAISAAATSARNHLESFVRKSSSASTTRTVPNADCAENGEDDEEIVVITENSRRGTVVGWDLVRFAGQARSDAGNWPDSSSTSRQK